jgi:uncharacterized membrane protein YeiH
MDIELVLLITGIIGTIAFAISGSLIAIENNLDLLGVMILGWTTACFGGLMRDVILDREIVMFKEPWYSLIALGVGLLVFVIMYFLKNLQWENSKVYKTIINIVDSVGLGSFVVIGAKAAMESTLTGIFPIIFFGVLTACGGGLVRDIMARKIPVIFRKHIYAIAAVVGCLVFYFMNMLCPISLVNVLVTVAVVVVIRYLAFYFEWSLPHVHLNN